MIRRRIGAALVIAVLLVACGAEPNEQPAPTGPANVVESCVARPIRAVLHVDGRDPRRVWGTELATGGDILVRPRAEEHWRIDPTDPSRLVDAEGKVATFEGEIFEHACFDIRTKTFYVGADDLPDPDRPPN